MSVATREVTTIGTAEGVTGGEIPRILHQIFFGGQGAVLPSYRLYSETWRKNHPGWDYQFWDVTRCRQLLERDYPSYLPMYDGYPHRIQRIDAVRYFILHRWGGVYVDMDIESLKPIDDLVAGSELLLGGLSVGYTNAVMGGAPGHMLWPHVFDMLRQRHRRFAWQAPLWSKMSMPMHVGYSTGPRMLSDCISQCAADAQSRVRICPSYVFEPLAPRSDRAAGRVIATPTVAPSRGGPSPSSTAPAQSAAPAVAAAQDDRRPSARSDIDLTGSYAIHHQSMHWLPFHHKVLSAIFNLVSKAPTNRHLGNG